MKSLLFGSIILTLSAIGFGNESPMSVLNFYASPGCGEDLSSDLIDISPTSQACEIEFREFDLSAEKRQNYSRDCRIEIKVKVKKGWRFRPTLATVDAGYGLDPHAKGEVKIDYLLRETGDRVIGHKRLHPGSEGHFSLEAPLVQPVYTNCANQDQVFHLKSDIRLGIDQARDGQSFIDVEDATTGRSADLRWEFEPCQPHHWRGEFNSYYRAINGVTYRAKLKFNGNTGYYNSEAGFTGQFSQVEYTPDGLGVRGVWSALNNHGTFHMRIVDTKEGRFRGTWRDHKGNSGTWWGYPKL